MKRCFKHILFILAYWLGVDELFYFLNRRAKRIVVFHNVIRDELCEGVPNDLVGMRLSEFNFIVREIAKRFRFSTDVFDARTVTLTFDDGYRNQYSTAFKRLQEFGIPAILFFSPGVRQVLAIDKMVFWRGLVPRSIIKDISAFWATEFWPRYLADGASRGMNTLAWLDSIANLEGLMKELPEAFIRERLGGIMTEELDEMRSAGWIIGWHTKTHTPLSALADKEVLDELDAPKEFRNVCMAYPYGTEERVGEIATRIAQKLGYPCALSFTNHSKRNEGQFFLPRIPSISSDRYELQAQLSGFSYFVSYRKLLPKVTGERCVR